ncbi:MAG: hypothetical protein GXP14_03855 [Gammaproteobacteria bacterium]|nr:hypothetical protein [Gammaproteobacteria bacterium]
MVELLNNPIIQSGIGPFFIAIISAWLLRHLGWLWAGLGFAIAYTCSVYWVIGLQFTPITSTKKIVLLGLAAVIVGLILDYLQPQRLIKLLIITLGATAASVWLVWPVAMRQSGLELYQFMAYPALYVTWLSLFLTSIENTSPEEDASISCLLGFTTGVLALLAASALLGQLGIAIGAAAGAYILLSFSSKPLKLGLNFTYPIAILCGLISITAVVYAKLPWYSLIPLALIPLVSYLPAGMAAHPFKRSLILAAMSTPLLASAIFLTWRTTGAPGF